MEAFGGVLRARRLSRGLTQEELSRLAGVSVRAVRDIERGRVRRPRKDSIRRLGAAVGLDPTALDERPGVDRLEIKLLGPLTVHRADAPVDVGPPRQRCVLGLLGLQPNRVVRQEEIIDVLWGADPPATSRNMVHAYVSRLRRLLPPRKGIALITGGDGGYCLTADSDQLDLLRVEPGRARRRPRRNAGRMDCVCCSTGTVKSQTHCPAASPPRTQRYDVPSLPRRGPASYKVVALLHHSAPSHCPANATAPVGKSENLAGAWFWTKGTCVFVVISVADTKPADAVPVQIKGYPGLYGTLQEGVRTIYAPTAPGRYDQRGGWIVLTMPANAPQETAVRMMISPANGATYN